LGTVPDASKLKELHGAGNSSYEFLPYDLPHSPVADSIRTIHASILFSASGQEDVVRSVVISSATAGEGKTFIAVSLATALTCNSSKQTCSSSKRILVVDCDLRRPSIHTVFRARLNDAGLTTLLTSDRLSVDNVIRRHHIPGLFYMTAGPMVPDPVPLLMSERFGEIVSELHNKFDFIIFDSPPILGFPEIRILSPHSDGLVLVVERGRTDQFELRSAATVISSIRNSRILGLVMNKTRPYRSQYLYSGSYYARDRSAARTPK
jgi:succinoglycan biosynthesis transport protein ExoP